MNIFRFAFDISDFENPLVVEVFRRPRVAKLPRQNFRVGQGICRLGLRANGQK